MRAPKTILIGGVVLTVTAATATILKAQQRFGGGGGASVTASSASLAQRSARALLMNGLDYLDKYNDHERALIYLREAQRRPGGLDDAEIKTLADALDRAERAADQAGPTQVAAVPQPRKVIGSRRDTIADAPTRDEPVQRASTVATEPAEPPAMDLPALPGEALPPATDDAPRPVASTAKPAETKRAPEPIHLTSSEPTEAPAQDVKAPSPINEPQDKAPVPDPTIPLQDTKNPAPAPAEGPAPPPELPTAPAEAPTEPPAEAPVPKATTPAADTQPQAPVDVKPIEDAPAEAPAPAPEQTTPSAAPTPTANQPTQTPSPIDPPAIAADELPPLPDNPAMATPRLAPSSSLRPESLRAVEEMARRQDEEARRNPPTFGQVVIAPGGSQDTNPSPLALPRAPSPTEPRPIRVIPVPDDFVPLPKRTWEPNRKYWAAAATCHMPLYFQDAVLERYGQSVEQAIGPHGRYFSYPLDDPRQSNQRNQILQPMYSAGMFITQMALLPYNMLMDPPWEAQYDLGYYRPGDKIPGDTYYLPTHGIGPPFHGNRY